MLKLAVNGWSYENLFMKGELTTAEWIDEVSKLPVDGAEVNGRYLTDLSPANLKALKHRALLRNLPLASFTVFNDFAKPEPDAELDKVRRAIGACRWLGTP